MAQDIRYVDDISPMVLGRGEFGVAGPHRQPYDMVRCSLAEFAGAVQGTDVQTIPWVQDFSLGAPDGLAEVAAQINAGWDGGMPSSCCGRRTAATTTRRWLGSRRRCPRRQLVTFRVRFVTIRAGTGRRGCRCDRKCALKRFRTEVTILHNARSAEAWLLSARCAAPYGRGPLISFAVSFDPYGRCVYVR
jgi:hypothetical protein